MSYQNGQIASKEELIDSFAMFKKAVEFEIFCPDNVSISFVCIHFDLTPPIYFYFQLQTLRQYAYAKVMSFVK